MAKTVLLAAILIVPLRLLLAQVENLATDAAPAAASAPLSAASAGREGPDEGLLLGPFRLGGDLTQRYRYRRSAGESDQDLYSAFHLDGACPAKTPEGRKSYPDLEFELSGSYNHCLYFHEQLSTSSSSACHRAAPSRAGATPIPGPPHPIARSNCYQCHLRPPHADNGMPCIGCHR
ncbi:MAG: hypothetical protein HY717_03855 [Planctomycetes bacterium]|nr:hypothetical protein [Planctomycetota bacterium]